MQVGYIQSLQNIRLSSARKRSMAILRYVSQCIEEALRYITFIFAKVKGTVWVVKAKLKIFGLIRSCGINCVFKRTRAHIIEYHEWHKFLHAVSNEAVTYGQHFKVSEIITYYSSS